MQCLFIFFYFILVSFQLEHFKIFIEAIHENRGRCIGVIFKNRRCGMGVISENSRCGMGVICEKRRRGMGHVGSYVKIRLWYESHT